MNSTTQSAPEQLADYRWLVGSEAAERLAEAVKTRHETGKEGVVRLADRLRRTLPAGRVHMILEQAELREKAKEKFPNADRMFFTPRGLQQASDAWVAAYKAARFRPGELAADLCCGIGGDLLALAARGPVRAVDRDPATAILAQANARSAPNDVVVSTADVANVSLSDVAAWHIDPDRRPSGRRTTKVALHEPGPAVLARLLAACPNAAIKLAPAAAFDEAWWGDAELEWISRDRECRQLVAWFGSLAKSPGQRRATILRAKATEAASFAGQGNEVCPIAARVGRYVFEPDAAVLAAKLEGSLAAVQRLSALAAGVAYFTADSPADHPALASFEVLEVMPYRIKPLRQWLAERNIGRLEVKKRGVRLDPDEVRRQVRADGDEEATVLLARIGGRTTAIIARRMST